MRRRIWPALALIFSARPCFSAEKFLVSVSVADLRAAPDAGSERLTQVLYGETLWVDQENRGWRHVEAPWQPAFGTTASWRGYPGWIKKDAVVPAPPDWPVVNVVVSTPTALEYHDSHNHVFSIPLMPGTELLVPGEVEGAEPGRDGWTPVRRVNDARARVRSSDVRPLTPPRPAADERRCVVEEAGSLTGLPYLWGGLSRDGVDCSGLTHLAYRVCGLVIPRDARDQKRKAEPVSDSSLAPGDLVFLSDAKDPGTARHVSLYAGGGEIIEAPATGLRVRRILLKDKLDGSFGKIVSYGRFIHE